MCRKQQKRIVVQKVKRQYSNKMVLEILTMLQETLQFGRLKTMEF